MSAAVRPVLVLMLLLAAAASVGAAAGHDGGHRPAPAIVADGQPLDTSWGDDYVDPLQ